jgi:methionyl-tRNA synthetase
MVEKYRDAVVPNASVPDDESNDTSEMLAYHDAMNGHNGWLLHDGLAAVARMTARANEYTQASAPWTVAKDAARAQELDVILASLIRRLARQAVLLAPFMPVKAQELWQQIGGSGEVHAQRFAQLDAMDVSGWRVAKGDGLFPRPVKS